MVSGLTDGWIGEVLVVGVLVVELVEDWSEVGW